MNKIYLDLKQIKSLIDAVFDDSEIKSLIEQNSLQDFDNEDLEELYYNHKALEAPFSEDGFIVLNDEVYLYIATKYNKDKVGTQLTALIEYRIYSVILNFSLI